MAKSKITSEMLGGAIKTTSAPSRRSRTDIAFITVRILLVAVSAYIFLSLPKFSSYKELEMEPKYRLFLMLLPILVLTFLFSYLPLLGWRYAFFDYKAGETLSADKFVGFKWFTQLFRNSATKKDIVRVIKNTLAMSGLGIATSWVAMVFAIFLSEDKLIQNGKV